MEFCASVEAGKKKAQSPNSWKAGCSPISNSQHQYTSSYLLAINAEILDSGSKHNEPEPAQSGRWLWSSVCQNEGRNHPSFRDY